MMAALVLNSKTKEKITLSDRIMGVFQKVYSPLLALALQRKRLILFIAVGFFLLSIFTFSRMGGEFIPTLDEGDFAVETRVMTGSSLSETISASTKAEKILLKQFPEINQVVSKIGSGEIPTDPMPVEACDLMIILKDRDEWTSAETREELADKMAKALEVIPGVTFGFQQPIQMRFNELMTGARQDVVIKIYGEDLDLLEENAKKIGKLINTVDGAQDLYIEEVTGLPQIQIKYNRDELAKYGISIKQVNTVIETSFAGKVAGQIYEGERRFDLVLRYDKAHREQIQDVQNMYVDLPNGLQIPLTQIASVAFEEGPNQIQRDDTKRRITIGFNVRNRDVETIVEEIKTKVEAQITLPVGYYTTYGGQFQNLVEAKDRLMIALPVALLLIFVLLYFTFKSVPQSLLILTAIPLSAIGGVFALYLRDMPFSISAGVGFIALFGVAVLNGIVLIGEFNQLKKEGVSDILERIKRGTKTRLRPVLMTAMVASFGFLPMALSGSSGAEVQRPLATVVIGGLITATLLTLIVLPILYIYFEKGMKKRKLPLVIGLGLLLLPNSLIAQQPISSITLDSAIQLALNNNGRIKSASLNIERNEELKKSSLDFGKTQFNWQHGQYNSPNKNDNYFSVSQLFEFPTVYLRNNQLAEAKIVSSQLQKLVTQNELISEVKSVFYSLEHAKRKRDLLERLDSIFVDFSRAATLRYETGESNILEKSTADVQLMEIRNKRQMAESQVRIFHSRLFTLLNMGDTLKFETKQMEIKRLFEEVNQEAAVSNNPNLVYLKQQIEMHQAEQRLQAAKALPDLTLGYFNQSLIGPNSVNGNNINFGSADRFTGIQIGLAVPLWYQPHSQKVSAAKLQTEISKNQFETIEAQVKGSFDQAIQEYLMYKNSLTYYESAALNQSELILDNAEKAFQGGAIGYYEYVLLINQSTQIQTTWLDSLNSYNQAVVHLEYMLGK
jgi:cobalt-zinc-cadmium resistance protein CzcA